MAIPLFEDRVLVCEGACNPDISDRDTATERYRRAVMSGGEDNRIRLGKFDVLSMMA